MASKQSVKITGLGISQFDCSLQGVQSLHNVIGSQIDYKTLSVYNTRADRGFNIFEAFNRYFSTEDEANGQEVLDIDKYVDPMGVLAEFGRRKGGLHLQDNVVEYFERRKADNKWYNITFLFSG